MRYLLLIFLLIPSLSEAAVWYIRSDGNTYGTTSTTCNGSADVAYSAGNGPSCAVSSIYEILSHLKDGTAATSGTTRISAGDTVIFSKASDTFAIGADRSNTPAGCSSSYPYACYLSPIPDGVDSSNKTKIYGYGYNTGCSTSTRVQLYGTQSVATIFNLAGSDNVEIACLELTDHDSCGFRLNPSACSEAYPADVGVYGRAAITGKTLSNIVITDVDIHGMAYQGTNIGGINGLTMTRVNIDGSAYTGFDGDVGHTGGESSFSGNLIFNTVNIRFSGCKEAYPRSSSFSASDYSNCVDQNDTPAGYGDGFGTYTTSGNWYFSNVNISHNASDGLDLLYGDGTNNLYIDKSLFEGNTGNQLKVSGLNIEVDNSILVANCKYLSDTGKVYNTGTFVNCRANGTPVALVPFLGSTVLFQNNSIYTGNGTGGSAAIESAMNASNCNGTETYTYKNNIYRSHDALWTLYYNGLTGACATAWNNASTSYSEIYNFQGAPCPAGTGNLCASNPLWANSFSATADSNLANMYLTSSSPGKGTGGSGFTYWNTSTDYNSFPQNSPVDMGALQYGSTPASSSTATKSITGKYKITGSYKFSL